MSQLIPAMPNVAPTVIAASGTWVSGTTINPDYKSIIAGVTSTQAGSLIINRYVDQAGSVLIDSHPATMTGGTPASLALVDGVPFGSFSVSISNSSGSPATISGFGVLLQR